MSYLGTLRSFSLSTLFLNEYKDKQPDWGYNGLGYVVYKRTYSRTKEDGTLEEFWETCARVVEGTYDAQKKHCKALKLQWDDRKSQRSAQEMYKRMWAFKWLPSGRGLWMMGSENVDKIGSAALNSCGMVSTAEITVDFAEPFCWLMDMLMLGVGIGFDTKGAGLVKIHTPQEIEGSFVVEDSREGWVALLRTVLTAYATKGGSIPSTIDYSKVRPAGVPIAGFGGVASGPQPLIDLIKAVRDTLDALSGNMITTTAIVDISDFVGRCVVSGNVRRSALLSLGGQDDQEFLDLKNPDINQEALMSHRWSANHSIAAEVGMDYSKVAAMTAKNGEPGYVWLDNARKFSRMDGPPDFSDMRVVGVNPCSEQSLENMENCNLVETFPSKHENFEDYKKTLKYAYLYAKTVTLIPTHSPRTNMVMMRNRRIGCSMSGIVQAMQKFGRRKFLSEFCDQGYKYLRELDVIYSDWLCIRPSIKITTVKPSGSVSLLSGVTPGIHFPHSHFYKRRVRLQVGSTLVEQLIKAGYEVEPDKYSPNTMVATFPVEEREYDRSKSDITLWEQLEMAAQMQEYWADNQVSVTVTFTKEEAKDIKYALELYETRLKGVSFLPISDHGYAQAPYETVTEEEYKLLAGKITQLSSDSLEHEVTTKYCDGDQCTI